MILYPLKNKIFFIIFELLHLNMQLKSMCNIVYANNISNTLKIKDN